MTEASFHHWLALGVIAVGAVTFLALLFITAPYGRHGRGGWGPTVSSRVAWMVMESPAALGFAAVYCMGSHALSPAPLALCAIWLTHYIHRAFIYPFRLRDARRPMPIAVAGMAIVFNLINAYLNARWISALGDYPASWLLAPRFLACAAIFAAGMVVNVTSDNILFALRKPGESGYKIPRGGAYRLVSAPNYLGELVEWAGWTVATWSLAGLAFFLFTFANLVPRALSNHKWYRETFADYPRERRAVIPWLL